MFDQYNFQFIVLHLFVLNTQEVILISLHCIIGGPAMIRAAAKNHSHVAVVVDPNDYDELLEHLASGTDSQEAVQYRKRLAWKAFQHCATYDSTVAEWLWSQIGKQMHCDMKLVRTSCSCFNHYRHGSSKHIKSVLYQVASYLC